MRCEDGEKERKKIDRRHDMKRTVNEKKKKSNNNKRHRVEIISGVKFGGIYK